MKTQIACVLPLVLFIVLRADAQNRTNRNNGSSGMNVNTDGPVTDCRDIRVTFEGKSAVNDQSEMILPASQVSTLRTQLSTGGVFITGWDRSEYSVKTCKSVPDDSDATGALRDIVTNKTGTTQISVSGPNDRPWTANLIIMVPRLSNMEIETRNGPLQLRDLAGNLQLKATNGPITLQNVGGIVETTATNGPISLSGVSGDQRINTTNGPVNLQLSGNHWDGPGLEVSTKNGPLSVAIPDAYSSAILIQTSDRSPMNCTAAACAGAYRNTTSPGTIQIGSGNPTVRLSTSNGPLSIRSARN
jgi:hypothetical protein